MDESKTGDSNGSTDPLAAPDIPNQSESPALTPDLELREVRQGTKPGSRYVRLTPRKQQAFRRVRQGEYRATDVALRPRSPIEAAWRGFKRVVVGAPLATSQLVEERLGKLKALAVFSSDMLSSSAYATEEILLVLVLAAAGAPHVLDWSTPIAIAISVLVMVVALSYSQVIRGYPNGGGSYAVARANLGTVPALLSGSSLVVDYTLTVAVSTAAGVAAIISAFPELEPYRIQLAIGSVFVMTLANLRGIRESGSLIAYPAYFFIASLTTLIIAGAVRLALGHDIQPSVPEEVIEPGFHAASLFLILRAFSSGATALTGIEAVSNGVPAFRKPEARNANITLTWMVCILAFFFLGLTVLAHQMEIAPAESRTVVAQIADGVFGQTPMFYAVQVATTMILLLAANTAFAGLPSLASVMARDRFLPRQFAFRGDRLAYSHGIIVLALASVGLLIIFAADTHRLIPLYAVGVFAGFTISQIGMVVHWRREGNNQSSLVVNALGAVATAIVTVIIASTKLIDGAWITIAAIGMLSVVFWRIHDHYNRVSRQLEVGETETARQSLRDDRGRGRPVVVPVDEINMAVLRTLEYAQSISHNVTAVHITDDIEDGESLRERWEATVSDTPIVIIESPYRSLLAPMLAYIDTLDQLDPGSYITVVLPEYVPSYFWEGLLHNQSSIRLKKALMRRPNTVVIDVPYHLD